MFCWVSGSMSSFDYAIHDCLSCSFKIGHCISLGKYRIFTFIFLYFDVSNTENEIYRCSLPHVLKHCNLPLFLNRFKTRFLF